LLIHVYDAPSGHCVVTILRPGKTPDGKEVRAHLHLLVRQIRLHWPNTVITIPGDSHYGRREAMDWVRGKCRPLRSRPVQERNVGRPGLRQGHEVRTRRAIGNLDSLRDYAEDPLRRARPEPYTRQYAAPATAVSCNATATPPTGSSLAPNR
jgi:hypothetical protein